MPTHSQVVDALLRGRPVTETPSIIQVAVGGRWEDSRSIDMPADPAAARALVRDAGAPDADLALEVEWLGSSLVFVGARRAQDPGDAARFEDDVAGVAERNPVDPGVALATLAGGPPAGLVHVEVGAANAWQSVGPMRIWTEGESWPPAPSDAAALLGERPTLAHCIAPLALEVTFSRPRECWIGVGLSEPSGDGHVLAAATLMAVIERLGHANA